MRRLVDIDEVIRVAKNTFPKEDVLKMAWVLAYTPTAYDVDKAAEAVEQYFDNELEQWFKGTEPQELYEYKENVLKIVRKGGVE
jgi:hypothetical protein